MNRRLLPWGNERRERQVILELIEEAVMSGARRHRACEVGGLDTRSVERWR